MPWNISFNNTRGIIELRYLGIVTPSELQDALKAASAMSQKEGIELFLADVRELSGGHSVTDLYFLISMFESAGIPKSVKEALLANSSGTSQQEIGFYETFCLNQGYTVKIFHDAQEAIHWLTSS